MIHFSCQGQTVQQKDEIVEDGIGQEPIVEAAPAETPSFEEHAQQAAEQGNSQQDQSDGHPAWKPLRDELGDVLFHKIKPHLSEFDSAANKRITDLNSKYEPWKQYADQGVTPDVVGRALGIVQGIDANPLEMFEALKTHLVSQGMLPAEADKVLEQAGIEDPEAEDEDPRDAELRALREQQEAIQQFLEQQEQARVEQEYNRQADAALTTEIEALRQARPGMTKDEEGLIFNRFALRVKAGEYDATLEKVAAEFDAERNRILSQPRPNDFAPRIPGAGGSAPTGVPQQKKPDEFTREESQAYFADLLMRGNQS